MKWLRVLQWIGGLVFVAFGLFWLPGLVGVGLFALKGDPRTYLDPYLNHLVQTPIGYFEPWQAVLVHGGLSIVPLLGGVTMLVWFRKIENIGRRP